MYYSRPRAGLQINSRTNYGTEQLNYQLPRKSQLEKLLNYTGVYFFTEYQQRIWNKIDRPNQINNTVGKNGKDWT